MQKGGPIVALESTIISHGMPYPQNLQMAREVEAVIEENGATPATIAVMGGKVCIGLGDEELLALAQAGHSAKKCSRRDLAMAVADDSIIAATTVAGTMYAANLAGIHVFATGGIGGVHRGGHNSMDMSADLTELARTPVAVVCAGAKSILDIGRTLEFLETHGVPVVGYGTSDFPAFFTQSSGFPVPIRQDDYSSCAGMINAGMDLDMTNGMVFAVPNPSPINSEQVEAATEQALQEADKAGISGRDITPFLLKRVNELTGGNSLESNIELVKNNAKVAAGIACALAELRDWDGMNSLRRNDKKISKLGRELEDHIYDYESHIDDFHEGIGL
jgi:pseudouridine-5'-phosphate glycosidase